MLRPLLKILVEERNFSDTHVHTSLTDGKNSIDEMCQKAQKNGLKYLVISEHVRKTLDYDYNKFYSLVQKNSNNILSVIAGSESKILDEYGNIDISSDVANKSGCIIASFHNSDITKEYFIKAAHKILDNKIVDIWGHPFSSKVDLNCKEFEELCIHAKENSKVIEINKRYPMDDKFFKIIKKINVEYLFCSDAHSVDEIIVAKIK